jgi:nucleoside-diphosphate-sugar epimerase
MIIGNGMIARAFQSVGYESSSITIFASGVSDSQCTDISQFDRERDMLENSLSSTNVCNVFIYFGTCSVNDPERLNSPYVQHKLTMENLVVKHQGGIVVRLPQVAGSHAPYNTLLSVICRKILSGEVITAWSGASRNIIDVVDVIRIVTALLAEHNENIKLPKILNVANSKSYNMKSIISSAEKALGKIANVVWIDKGSEYKIDVSYIYSSFAKLGITFDDDYLVNVIRRYYQ